MTFAPCESSGYVTFSKSLTFRYPSSLPWEGLHEASASRFILQVAMLLHIFDLPMGWYAVAKGDHCGHSTKFCVLSRLPLLMTRSTFVLSAFLLCLSVQHEFGLWHSPAPGGGPRRA